MKNILDNDTISRLVGYRRTLTESSYTIPAQLAPAPEPAPEQIASKPESIIFKCPAHNGNDELYAKAVKRTVDKRSLEFTGVAISSIFVKPNGNFNLYGKTYFYGKDGSVYYFEGRDTENWKGFKLLIAKSNVTADTATPEQLAVIKRVTEGTLVPTRVPGVFGDLSASGKSNMPDRVVNNSGDNGMQDPIVDEDMAQSTVTPEMLDQLHGLLTRIGVDDSDIALNSVMLRPSGCVKVSKALTGQALGEEEAVAFCKNAISALSKKLAGTSVDEDEYEADGDDDLNEFYDMPADSRFTYVIDAMGDVAINDTHAGTTVHLRGSDAVELIGELQMHGGTAEAEQEILSQYQHVMEDGAEDSEVDEDVKMGQYFNSEGLPEMLGDLMHDVHAMSDKLRQVAQTSMKNGDVQTKFAAEVFQGELSKFEHAVNDYMAKSTD